jgi:hypothetical protein
MCVFVVDFSFGSFGDVLCVSNLPSFLCDVSLEIVLSSMDAAANSNRF